MEKSEKGVNKPLYIILSILVACGLWLYVRNVDNPDTTMPVRNVPITFVGADTLEDNNLMMVGHDADSIDLEVQGKWSIVSQLRRNNITIQVDLSRITAAGQHNLVPEILWPSGIQANNVVVKDQDPVYVSVSVIRQVSRPVEVRGVFTGSIADGYQADMEGFTFQPATIEVSGEEAEVARVAYAEVTLNRQELKDTVREEAPYILIGQDGEPITDSTLKTEPATVTVTLPVVMVKQVPLTVDLIAGGGADPRDTDNVSYVIEPASIMLSGSERDLAAYSDINLGSIDLSKVISTSRYTFPIPLGAEVENISGVQEATVEVTVRNLEIREFFIDDIEIINAPEGVATPVTQFIRVRVRGTAEALDLILPQYIRVVVDLKDMTLPAGQNGVTPKVMLSGISDAGVIGDYKVSIFLTRGIEREGGGG